MNFVGVEPTAPAFLWRTAPRQYKRKIGVPGNQGRLANALVQLQARYHHCGVAASEKCLLAAMFVRLRRRAEFHTVCTG